LIKSRGIKLSPNVKIVFGNNVSGLAAAAEWGKLWPSTKKNIIITCSVYRASQKIWGPDVRALPVERNPVRIISSSGECEEMRPMEGRWTSSSFVATESRLFYDLIDRLKRNQSLDFLGVLGKFSSADDCNRYGIVEDSVCWFPTDNSDEKWFDDILPALKTSLQF